jgi:hypothetical protein
MTPRRHQTFAKTPEQVIPSLIAKEQNKNHESNGKIIVTRRFTDKENISFSISWEDFL